MWLLHTEICTQLCALTLPHIAGIDFIQTQFDYTIANQLPSIHFIDLKTFVHSETCKACSYCLHLNGQQKIFLASLLTGVTHADAIQ
jgi:hypothetical protein